MKLSKRQKDMLYGMVLGDAYLQKTGEKNARLRLEHSLKQRAYMEWKYQQLKHLFQSKPKLMRRRHPQSRKVYDYLRLQSHSSPFFGRLREKFYDRSGKKILPQDLSEVLSSPLTIGVWYMDDGYYDREDKSAHIYLPLLTHEQMDALVATFRKNYAIVPKWYCRPDRKGCQLNFTGDNKDKFIRLVTPYLIPAMRYKVPS